MITMDSGFLAFPLSMTNPLPFSAVKLASTVNVREHDGSVLSGKSRTAYVHVAWCCCAETVARPAPCCCVARWTGHVAPGVTGTCRIVRAEVIVELPLIATEGCFRHARG